MARTPTRYGTPPPERPRVAPKTRGVGRVPNPRRPRLVRDVNGGELLDLFAVFPDLPRPRRPRARVPLRVLARRLRKEGR